MNDDETLPGEFLLGTLDPHEQMFVFAPVTNMIAARIDDDGTVRLSKDTVAAIQRAESAEAARDRLAERVEELEPHRSPEPEPAAGEVTCGTCKSHGITLPDDGAGSGWCRGGCRNGVVQSAHAACSDHVPQSPPKQPAAGEVPDCVPQDRLGGMSMDEAVAAMKAGVRDAFSEVTPPCVAAVREHWPDAKDRLGHILEPHYFEALEYLATTAQPTAAEVPECECGDPDAECPIHDGDGDPPPKPAAGEVPGGVCCAKCGYCLEPCPNCGSRAPRLAVCDGNRAAVAAFDESAQQFHPGFSTSRTTAMTNHPRQSSDPAPDGHDEPYDGCGGVGYPPSAEVESEPCSHRCVPAGEDGDCVGVGLQFVGMAQGEAEFCVSIGERTAHWFVSQEMWNAFAEAAGWLPVEQPADPPCYCAETSTRNCPAHAPLLFEETSLDRGGETEPSVDRDWAACPHRWVVDEVLSGQGTPADAPEACALAQRVLWAAANPTGSKR